MSDFTFYAFVALCLYIILCAPIGIFCTQYYRASNGVHKVPMSVRLQAYLPVWNIVYCRKLVYGTAKAAYIVLGIVLAIFALRIFAVINIAAFPILIIYTAMFNLFAVALFWLFIMIQGIRLAQLFDSSFVYFFAMIVVPPLGYYFLANRAIIFMKEGVDNVKGTFDGD